MTLSKKQKFIIIGGILLVAVAIYALGSNLRPRAPATTVKLLIWGVEDEGAVSKLVDGYNASQPFPADITYVRFDPAVYEEKLLNALAAGTGPDVFEISNRGVNRNFDKITSADPTLIDLATMQNLFPQVVEQDFVRFGSVYALPLYLDTMALIYNKNLFDQAGLVAPPKNWNDFVKMIPLLEKQDEMGNMIRAAAAIGGSGKSVDSAPDLLSLIMLQKGVKMTSDDYLHSSFSSTGGNEAMSFYTQFGNPNSPYYTWDEAKGDSLSSFGNGKTAMIFNYKRALGILKAKSPFLNIGVAPVPQPFGGDLAVTYANYKGLVVSKQTKFPTDAWKFVYAAAATVPVNKSFLDATGEPPALRSLIAEKIKDLEFGVFARQALTARSWYDPDNVKTDGIFNAAISSVLSGELTPEQATSRADSQVDALFQ